MPIAMICKGAIRSRYARRKALRRSLTSFVYLHDQSIAGYGGTEYAVNSGTAEEGVGSRPTRTFAKLRGRHDHVYAKHSRIFQAELEDIEITDTARHRWQAVGKPVPPDGSIRTNHAVLDARDVGRSPHKVLSAGCRASCAAKPSGVYMHAASCVNVSQRLGNGCILISS